MSAEIVAQLAVEQGLARAPLFRANEVPSPSSHEVLLDGLHGSFAASVDADIAPIEACSWVWSSNVPHHVLIRGDTLQVTRWDRPRDIQSFRTSTVLAEPDAFQDFLRRDKVQTAGNIVEHSLRLFRTVRNLLHHAGIDDRLATTAYLELLRSTMTANGRPKWERPLILPELPAASLENILLRFMAPGGASDLTAVPALAIRHASGAIFQEAHFELLAGAPKDLFDYVAPAAALVGRAGVHFTPPPLARAIAEQALLRVPGLHEKGTLTVTDISCGSGAFLIETLRALERFSYAGSVRIVGRDISPVAVEMARFALYVAGNEWPGPLRCSIDIAVADSLLEAAPPSDVFVMNPPFAAWADLSPAAREQVRTALGADARGRMDLSMAFVNRALESLGPAGVLATLVPANLLESETAAPWRARLVDGRAVSFAGVFDHVKIFEHATVRVAAFVLAPKGAPQTVLRAGAGPEDASDSMRALRRGGDWLCRHSYVRTVVRSPEVTSPWIGGAKIDRHLSAKALENGIPTLKHLFDLRQGIRTGDNRAFVLSGTELSRLPAGERHHFRSAITSKWINNGRITQHVHVFPIRRRSNSRRGRIEAPRAHLLRQIPRAPPRGAAARGSGEVVGADPPSAGTRLCPYSNRLQVLRLTGRNCAGGRRETVNPARLRMGANGRPVRRARTGCGPYDGLLGASQLRDILLHCCGTLAGGRGRSARHEPTISRRRPAARPQSPAPRNPRCDSRARPVRPCTIRRWWIASVRR